MAAWLLWALGVALIALEGVALQALGIDGFALQTPIVLATYAGMRRGFVSSGWVLFGWLLPIEWVVAGPGGLYVSGVVAIFFGLRLISQKLERPWNLAKSLICVGAALAHHLGLAAWLLVTRPEAQSLEAVWSTSLSGALITGVSSIPLGLGLWHIERLLDVRRGDGELELEG